MSGYYYISSEPGLWTVGHGTPGVDWEPESDHGSIREAVARIAYLNGGPAPNADNELRATVRTLVEQMGELVQALHGMAGVIRPQASPAGRDPDPAPEGPAVATTGQPGGNRTEVIAGFRELADYLEAHPDVPIDRYAASIQLHVSNLDHMQGKDEPEVFAELARIAGELGVDPDLRDEPGAPHPHVTRTFRGGVEYHAVLVTKAYKRGYKDADETLLGVVEVAGPVAGPATTPDDKPDPVWPIVLVESPIPSGPPARAEVREDNGGTTVKVVYCDSRTGARVARRRILGPAPSESEG